MCVCRCMCTHIHIHTNTHIHTQTYIRLKFVTVVCVFTLWISFFHQTWNDELLPSFRVYVLEISWLISSVTLTEWLTDQDTFRYRHVHMCNFDGSSYHFISLAIIEGRCMYIEENIIISGFNLIVKLTNRTKLCVSFLLFSFQNKTHIGNGMIL